MPMKNEGFWNVQRVGQAFLDFYSSRGYLKMAGTSLLHKAIPTSFVMSAGLVQFEVFADASAAGDRYVLIQNCFRHFDIERVGSSDFHLSLFRMPGAFCFGPPAHEDLVAEAWKLLTEIYRLDPASLWVTCFAGEPVEGIHQPRDIPTIQAWRAVGVPPEHLLVLGERDNFWRQSKEQTRGMPRRCGPNTEVFYDRGESLGCGPICRPGCTCGRFVEFLNLLFITWTLDEQAGELHPLEMPFTELVIGQERVAALLSGKTSIYQVDELQPLVNQVQNTACTGKLSERECQICTHLVADHLRALLFLYADGAPGPKGKGERTYIIQRLMRQALESQWVLGISDPGFQRTMLYALAQVYPRLKNVSGRLLTDLQAEQNRFEHTIQTDLRHLEEWLSRQKTEPVNLEQAVQIARGVPPLLLSVFFESRGLVFDRSKVQETIRRVRLSQADSGEKFL